MNKGNDIANKIINEADIVQVINNYIHLEPKGNDYKGLCPFHDDKNPSLSVSPKRKIYKCFSCGAAGTVINFVQNYEKIQFLEAIKKIANICKIDIEIYESPHNKKILRYLKLVDEVTTTYEFYLHNTKEGEIAFEYLKNRGFDSDLIKHFRIGLSSSNTNIITKTFIENEKYLPVDLLDLSLIGQQNNTYYDFFKARIIFPIQDLKGNVVGFSGRIYNADSNSKYINSRESIIFKKSSILYNYYNALNEIRKLDSIILFEGPIDVFAAYRAKVFNSVCTMGTALTEEQVKIIVNVTKNITIAYDADLPGINATKKAISLFNKYDVNLKVAVFPTGQDPDDYLNKHGELALVDILNNKSVNAIDYFYTVFKRDLNLDDVNSINNFLIELKKLVSDNKSKVIENYIIKKASQDLKMSEEDLTIEFKNKPILNLYPSDNNINFQYNEIPYDDIPSSNIPDNSNLADIGDIPFIDIIEKKKNKYIKAEENIIYLAFKNRDKCLFIKKNLGIDDFVDKINRDILFKLYDYYDIIENMNPVDFFEKLDDLEMNRLNLIINTTDFIIKDENDSSYYINSLSKNVNDLIDVIKKSKYYKKINDIKEKATINPIDSKLLEEHINSKKKTIKIIKNKKES